AEPEASVDTKIGAPPVACWDQFLDCRVDRRIFAADTGSSNEAAEREGMEVVGECGRARPEDIDTERHEEMTFAAEQVGEPTEQQSPEDGTGEIGARRK